MSEDTAQPGLRVPTDLHDQMKDVAALHGVTVQDAYVQAARMLVHQVSIQQGGKLPELRAKIGPGRPRKK